MPLNEEMLEGEEMDVRWKSVGICFDLQIYEKKKKNESENHMMVVQTNHMSNVKYFLLITTISSQHLSYSNKKK